MHVFEAGLCFPVRIFSVDRHAAHPASFLILLLTALRTPGRLCERPVRSEVFEYNHSIPPFQPFCAAGSGGLLCFTAFWVISRLCVHS
jgi:hypothetical protein